MVLIGGQQYMQVKMQVFDAIPPDACLSMHKERSNNKPILSPFKWLRELKHAGKKWYDVIDHQWELDWEGLYFQLLFICDNQGGY